MWLLGVRHWSGVVLRCGHCLAMVWCGQISVVEVSGKTTGKDKHQQDKYQLAHALHILVHPPDADPQSIQNLN